MFFRILPLLAIQASIMAWELFSEKYVFVLLQGAPSVLKGEVNVRVEPKLRSQNTSFVQPQRWIYAKMTGSDL